MTGIKTTACLLIGLVLLAALVDDADGKSGQRVKQKKFGLPPLPPQKQRKTGSNTVADITLR